MKQDRLINALHGVNWREAASAEQLADWLLPHIQHVQLASEASAASPPPAGEKKLLELDNGPVHMFIHGAVLYAAASVKGELLMQLQMITALKVFMEIEPAVSKQAVDIMRAVAPDSDPIKGYHYERSHEG